MAADTKALVTALGLPRFHLAGVSMGGAIAQEYAVAHPGDLLSLVLANTFAVADPFTRAAFETWATVAETAGMPVMMRQQAPWIFSPGFYEQYPDRVTELIAAAQASTQPAAAFAAQMAALTGHDFAAGSARSGADARARRQRRHHRSGRRFSAAVRCLRPGRRHLDGRSGGHAAFWENPGPWNQAVIDFVRRNGTSA